MLYLGNIVIARQIYYNFFPGATLEDGALVKLSAAEAKRRFPLLGNIGIAYERSDAEFLRRNFTNGQICLLELPEPEKLERNLSRDTRTQKEITVSALRSGNAIHSPGECGVYPILEARDVEAALESGGHLRLRAKPTDALDLLAGADVLLRLGEGELVGPFRLNRTSEEDSYEIDPQSEARNHLFDVYQLPADGALCVQIADRRASEASGAQAKFNLRLRAKAGARAPGLHLGRRAAGGQRPWPRGRFTHGRNRRRACGAAVGDV